MRRHVGPRVDALLVAVDDLDADPAVVALVDAFGAVETIEVLRREQVEHAVGRRRGIDSEVGDAALARTNRQIEGEAIAVKATGDRATRTHPAALDEGRPLHVAAVGEVPKRVVCHSGTAMPRFTAGRVPNRSTHAARLLNGVTRLAWASKAALIHG